MQPNSAKPIDALTKRDYLSAFMNLYWLRPETAVWRTLDCLAFADVVFRAPILDLGCGDGLFSFTRAGGLLHPSHDVFVQTRELENFSADADIYDHFDASAAAPVRVREPAYVIDVGFDRKQTLLRKAASLGIYREVVHGDANRTLPFGAVKFRTVFCNILYWLGDYRHTLADIRRVLAPDGQAAVLVPSETFRDYSFYQRLHVQPGDPRWAWLQRIDRGRSDDIHICRDFNSWRADFQSAGLAIAYHRQYLSKTVLEAWDIGLRPISPYLIEMAGKLDPADRLDIKTRWIADVMALIEPLCELDWMTDATHPPGFHLFVLEKMT